MSSDVLTLTRGEWLGPIPHDYEAKPEWLADDAIVMVAFNPREHQVAMTWEFAEKRKAPARGRDWAAVTAFCVEISTGRRTTPAGDAVERVARALAPHLEGYVEYDQMPRNKAELREAVYEGRHTNINAATQDDAVDASRAAIAAMGGTTPEPQNG